MVVITAGIEHGIVNSPEFLGFKERGPQFVLVDRVESHSVLDVIVEAVIEAEHFVEKIGAWKALELADVRGIAQLGEAALQHFQVGREVVGVFEVIAFARVQDFPALGQPASARASAPCIACWLAMSGVSGGELRQATARAIGMTSMSRLLRGGNATGAPWPAPPTGERSASLG